MADASKTILKEITLWKKRLADSSKTISGVYKELTRDAKKVYKEVRK